MSEKPTPEEVRASIVPKSDQLNADDLLTGPLTVTITKVRRGNREQPIIVELEGHRPYKPCKTMRRILIAQFTDDPKNWIGQQMTLFCDPNVAWAGVKVGGIRISHLSGLENPRTFLLTIGRGKRSEVTIQPIVSLTPKQQEFVAEASEEIQAAETLGILRAHGEKLQEEAPAVQDALRPVYAKRKKELSE